jgi:signal peptide peptidase SppA
MTPERCAAQHFGYWCVEPQWFAQAVSAVRSGMMQPGKPGEPASYQMAGSVAVIGIEGHMTKGRSSFGGASTVEIRRMLAKAQSDEAVKSILLNIDSPGGTADGTAELGDAVAKSRKPVRAFVGGMACSAAYWIASQADRIDAGRTNFIGSIGTVAVLEDVTGMMDKAGIKMRVVSTGPYKGLGMDGAITDALVEDVQREINDLNAHFLAAVADGRGMPMETVRTLADGRSHTGDKALALGLIDGLSTLDDILTEMNMEIDHAALMAENEKLTRLLDQATKPASAAELKAAFPGDTGFVLDQLEKNATLTDAKAARAESLAAQLAAANERIASLEKELAKATTGQSALPALIEPDAPADPFDGLEGEARIDAEWQANHNGCQDKFKVYNAYLGFRRSMAEKPAMPAKKA